jgi:hypothetical protein
MCLFRFLPVFNWVVYFPIVEFLRVLNLLQVTAHYQMCLLQFLFFCKYVAYVLISCVLHELVL